MGLIVLAMCATGAMTFPHLPALMGGGPRLWMVLPLPLIAVALWGLWTLLPRIDPIAPGFKGFRYAYDFFWILLLAALAFVYATMLGDQFGWTLTPTGVALPGAGILLLAVGIILPRIRRNWFFGIRTPWTLTSDAVWDRTNRLGAWLFAIAGVVSLVGSIVAPHAVIWFLLVPVVVAAVVSVTYSYVLFARAL